MYSDEKKINKLFLYWLTITLILVFSIIIVGGLTRLTNSGLSITEWELVKGILPPITYSDWEFYFDRYKKIPQYKLLNFDMEMEQFKIIFYWEYFHRILARFIGLFFLLPLIFFYFSKKIDIKYLRICFVIFVLIVLQGIVGWYMVKSGLISDTTVSHYRLSIHLSIAFLIISIIFWLIMNSKSKKNKLFFKITKSNLFFLILILLIFIQIIIGAFVSGLDAGKIYQTWPLMGNSYLPNDLTINNFKNIVEFDNHSLVQFYHRNLAYLLVFYVLLLSFFIFKNKILVLYKPLIILLFFLFLQALLGVFTLISGLNIYLASLHQTTSVILLLSAINLYYFKLN